MDSYRKRGFKSPSSHSRRPRNSKGFGAFTIWFTETVHLRLSGASGWTLSTPRIGTLPGRCSVGRSRPPGGPRGPDAADLRAVALMRSTTSSWVGLLWLDTDDGLVSAIDLRALAAIAS